VNAVQIRRAELTAAAEEKHREGQRRLRVENLERAEREGMAFGVIEVERAELAPPPAEIEGSIEVRPPAAPQEEDQ
jgi:hypothetical protein